MFLWLTTRFTESSVSCSKGRGFESQHRMLDGHIDIYLKKRPGWPVFFYKKLPFRESSFGDMFLYDLSLNLWMIASECFRVFTNQSKLVLEKLKKQHLLFCSRFTSWPRASLTSSVAKFMALTSTNLVTLLGTQTVLTTEVNLAPIEFAPYFCKFIIREHSPYGELSLYLLLDWFVFAQINRRWAVPVILLLKLVFSAIGNA